MYLACDSMDIALSGVSDQTIQKGSTYTFVTVRLFNEHLNEIQSLACKLRAPTGAGVNKTVHGVVLFGDHNDPERWIFQNAFVYFESIFPSGARIPFQEKL